MQNAALVPLALLACAACVSNRAEPHDAAKRAALFAPVKALEGSWETPGPDGKPMVIEFKVSSAGSVVREIMFPGSEHEMTNVYRLEGNALALTHYCAMGNQPELRAVAFDGKRLDFGLVGVADMDSPDEVYMGALSLEFVDHDHLVEHWRSYVKDVAQPKHAADFALVRRK